MNRRVMVALVPLLVAGAAGWWWLVRPDAGASEHTGIGTHYAVTVRFDSAPGSGMVTANIRIEPDSADGVWISSVMPDMGHTTPELVADPQGPGRFRASGELFPMAGAWDLAVRVKGPPGSELVTVHIAIAG